MQYALIFYDLQLILAQMGLLPPAYVSPAAMRATRDLLRRRMSRTRPRAELLAPIQHTNSPDNRPEMGKKLAYQANRDGVAERFPAPAVQQSMAVDLARLGYYAPLLSALEWHIVTVATQHDAHTRSLLQTVPGLGTSLRLVLLDESHDLQRCPRVQDCLSSGRLVKCAKTSAGTRYGTAGAKRGKASLTWACSEAAVLLLRDHPAGHKSLPRPEKPHGQGTALPLLAQKRGRAVYDRFTRPKACDRHQLLHAECAERVSLTPHWTCTGGACGACAARLVSRRQCTPRSPEAIIPEPAAVAWTPAPAPLHRAMVAKGDGCCPSPEPGPHWRTPVVQPLLSLGR